MVKLKNNVNKDQYSVKIVPHLWQLFLSKTKVINTFVDGKNFLVNLNVSSHIYIGH